MAQSHIDPYVALGVAPDASPRQLARAYRRLAKQYHPDLNTDPAASQRMRRINEAWHTVSRQLRNRHYTPTRARTGHWAAARRARPAPSSAAPRGTTWGEVKARVHAPGSVAAAAPAGEVGFRDSGWAALVAGAGIVLLVVLAAVLGNAQPLP